MRRGTRGGGFAKEALAGSDVSGFTSVSLFHPASSILGLDRAGRRGGRDGLAESRTPPAYKEFEFSVSLEEGTAVSLFQPDSAISSPSLGPERDHFIRRSFGRACGDGTSSRKSAWKALFVVQAAQEQSSPCVALLFSGSMELDCICLGTSANIGGPEPDALDC